MADKIVRVIPSFMPILSAHTTGGMKKRKVAAYARVSTDRDEQQSSYEAQVAHYTQYIQGKRLPNKHERGKKHENPENDERAGSHASPGPAHDGIGR